MGLYDRDYGREYGDETPWDRHQRSQNKQAKSAAIILMIVTVVIHFIDMMSLETVNGHKMGWLFPHFATFTDTALKPWQWYQFLTYGFLHDQNNLGHVVFNMVGLFFFGRAIEQKLGFDEFLRFYLVSMLVGGIVGCLGFWLMGVPNGSVIGASGAVMAATVLFACYYPNSEILLMFVIPVKAWVLAAVFVIYNVGGAVSTLTGIGQSTTSFTVHLAGIAFGFLYYYRNWHLGWLDFRKLSNVKASMSQRSRRMKLKLHDPDRKIEDEASEADRILAKIHESGEESLTNAERKLLQRYSRRQRERRQS